MASTLFNKKWMNPSFTAGQQSPDLGMNDYAGMQDFVLAESPAYQNIIGKTTTGLPYSPIGNTVGTSTNSSGFDFGNLMSGDFLQGAGSVLGGVGALGQAYAGIKGLGLAEDRMAQQNAQWGKNFNAQLASSLGQARNIAEWQRASGANPTYDRTVSELENLRVA